MFFNLIAWIFGYQYCRISVGIFHKKEWSAT